MALVQCILVDVSGKINNGDDRDVSWMGTKHGS